MNLFVKVLKEKYNINVNEEKNKEDNKENKNFEIKKSGVFTGTKASQTYQKNHIQHLVNHSLNKNINKKSLSESIKESYIFFENSAPNSNEKSVVYRRNVKTPQGTNKLTFPHSAVAKTISKETPNKPKDGIGIKTKDNTIGLSTDFNKKLRIIRKLLQKG